MNAMNKANELMTVRQFAERTGYKRKTVYNLIRAGKLPAFRLSKKAIRFRVEDVERWIDSRRRCEVYAQKGVKLIDDS